jgi:sulfate transport system ATP-binding protein
MEVASRVVVLNHGRIEQQGAPSDIYDYPANAFVSQFIGQTNIFTAELHDSDWLQESGLEVSHQVGKIAHVRPHDIVIEKAANVETAQAILKDWQHLGALMRLELVKKLANGQAAGLFAEMPNEQFKALQLNRGDAVSVQIRKAHWFH